ncbi:MAG: hybrid sensor histidine kinase/response regulator, partial [Perlucidibaca sp.]
LSALLDISRLDAGALTPSREALNLSAMVRELCTQVAPVAGRRQLRLRQHLPRQDVWVTSDRQWLRRILQNLLSNALRYTREGGVLVGLRRRACGRWRLDVRDTGPGIPAGKQAQIFEEFQRGGEASPWGEKGMGLGLAIVERMVRLLGHDIAVSSTPGRGACFSLTLEAANAIASTPLPPEPASQSAGSLQGLCVLCVDNEPDILAGMRALLGRWGCMVVTAGSGHEARAQLRRHDPVVVLADYHLADGEDGLLLLRELAVGRAGALVTADHTDEVAAAVKTAGLGLLRKPVKPAALRAFLSAQAG